jgi:hypothetical protein
MSTSTLTERYVQEVVRRLPADQRDDVAVELRTTIADTVDARNGTDPASAERAVLAELGDPHRYAARCADRPLALIGPDLYPRYTRLLKVLLTAVLPVVTALLMVLEALEGNGAGAVIGTGVGAVVIVGSQMIAWSTLVFALVDRAGRRAGAGLAREWTPDDLPEFRGRDKGGAAACAAAVWNGLLLGLTVWQHIAEPYRAENGEQLQILAPGLWSGWIWPVLLGLAGLVVVQLARAAMHGWTVALAGAYTAAHAVFALPLAWLLYDQRLLDKAFLTDFNGENWTTPDAFFTGAALVVLLAAVTGAAKALRAARG